MKGFPDAESSVWLWISHQHDQASHYSPPWFGRQTWNISKLFEHFKSLHLCPPCHSKWLAGSISTGSTLVSVWPEEEHGASPTEAPRCDFWSLTAACRSVIKSVIWIMNNLNNYDIIWSHPVQLLVYTVLFIFLHVSSDKEGQGAAWKLGGVKFQMQLMLIDALGDVRAVGISQSTHEDMNRNVNNSFSPINFWGSCLVHSFLSHCTFLNYIWWAQSVLEGFIITVRACLLYEHVSRSLLSKGVRRISSELNVIDLKESKGSYM